MALCLEKKGPIPQWYLAVTEEGEIAGGMGVIENDFHTRPDLTPNVCAVYVEPAFRGKGPGPADDGKPV
ncbi:MAG: GNAT family N-acetyltransferase, partial [Clostridiales bacterium]|nr:GNAT family N-acetyltransferase [Clostridiales bacterium]